MKKSTVNTSSGFAMVEVLVTAVVVAIGISGMGVLLLKSLQGTQDNAQRSQAMWIVQDFVGRIRANSEGARAGEYVMTTQLSCEKKPDPYCADHRIPKPGVPSGELVKGDYCPDSGMAAFDLWITACGSNPGIYTSPSDFMASPELTSRCIETSDRQRSRSGENDCVRYQIDFTWDTRVKQAGDTEAERVYTNTYSQVVEVN